jgi:hemerythrin superfamily protein
MNGSGDMHTNLVQLLLADHRQAEHLLDRFADVGADRRDEAFCELTYTLVRHEVAEEEVVYPVLRRYVDGGDDLADMRIAEQAKAEELLAEMEKAGVDSAAFPAMFTTLRSEVLAHAQAEELSVFPELTTSVRADELRELGTRYNLAKKVAPNHPHPHAPDTPPGNLVLGPVAAVVDRARDAIRAVRT